MYLKMLEIQGFKSFPDKIKLEFGQGITSIVGPNGSGKSNISDAVRWVMGEQSVKNLRGSKMEDIIFAGTQDRKALGFAEVSLTLDNIDKIVPIDFNEVTITRRVYRSGESEYYINKSSCRLKDLRQLFMDTGLGKEGYSIVGQGRIDEILSTKSEDRRHVFEEAAGITKYKYRKQEAEKKLELTRQNLVRIKDIITELELQIEPLQEQSEKAKKFLTLKEELKVLEINVSLHAIEKLKKDLAELEENYHLLQSQFDDNQSALKQLETEIEKLYQQVKSKEEEIAQARQDLHNDEKLLERYKNDIELLKNNILNNDANIHKMDMEVEQVVLKIKNLETELSGKSGSLEKLVHSKGEMRHALHALESDNEKVFALIESGNQAIDSLKSELIEKMNEGSEKKGKINSVKVLEGNFNERKKGIEKDVGQKNIDIERVQSLLEKLEKDFAANEESLRKNQELLAGYQAKQSEEKQQSERLRDEYNRQLALMNGKISKKKLLKDMENDYEGYYKSVKSVLLEWQKGCLKHLHIHGPLTQLIKVPKNYVTAIETALGAAMQHIVVDNEQDAKTAIGFLKARRLGRATFLPVSSVKGTVLHYGDQIKDFPGSLGIASQLIAFDDRYTNIVNNLLGRVVVVENIDHGIKMARKFGYKFRIVTLEGDILNPGGSMTGGSVNKSSGFLSRANEIKSLDGEIVRLRSALNEIDNKIKAKDTEMQHIHAKLSESETGIKESGNVKIKLESELLHNKTIYDNLMTNRAELLKEKTQVEEQIEHIRNEMLEFSNTIKALEQDIRQIEHSISERQASYAEELAEKERLAQAITERKMALHSLEKDIELTEERIRTIQLELNTCQKDQTRKEHECLMLKKNNETIRQEIEEKNEQILICDENKRGIQEKIEQAISDKAEKEGLIERTQVSLKEKRENSAVLQDGYRKIENKKIRIELELENTINKLWDEYEQTFTTALAYKKEIDNLAQVKKTIAVLKDEIRALGNINVNAIEEYKNVKERYEFLSGQRDDLEEAEKSLVKIIDDMVVLMNKQFSEKFKIINQNFNLVFNELFGGGRAALKLSEPDNILESGIEIEVQPPGKKLQNLMLLSGGERAFTAIALLFAILKVRPTPFCILDEIEAALDDANVYRFAEYLKNFSQQTQFIIVTHRRGTMEMSDVLYGVTMQEKGVSKLLALKMEEIAS